MRGLSAPFFAALDTGVLQPLRLRVARDRTLCLEIRDDSLNLYYRGGSVLRLSPAHGGYLAEFDAKYFAPGVAPPVYPRTLSSASDVDAWLAALPHLKEAVDLHLGGHTKDEREVQQWIVRENNFGGVARATDYFICDIEYANAHGRFDLVAVHWPSSPSARKNASDRRLVLAEVKCGDDALTGTSGLVAHVRDVNAFLSDAKRVASLKDEMREVFNQKLRLGLIDCGKPLEGFSDDPPMLLLVLANHDPDSTILRAALSALPPSPHAELRVARASLMGYGLFDQGIADVAGVT